MSVPIKVGDSRLLVLCACKRWLAWDELPSAGIQDDGAGGTIELKNCPDCESTRALCSLHEAELHERLVADTEPRLSAERDTREEEVW